MKRQFGRRFLIGLVLITIIVGGFSLRFIMVGPVESAPEDIEKNPQVSQVEEPEAFFQIEEGAEYEIAPNTPDSRLLRRSDGFVEYLPSTEISKRLGSGVSADSDLAILDRVFFYYRYAYRENPIGVENIEFTEQLLGNNPKNIIFVSEEVAALKNGELVDRWGTPYFFHPMASDSMEIRSAGPDSRLWTEDDFLLEGEANL
ncbi:MAG: hypothetical protein AAGH40_10405 [Verrucomicrobiota bacterium]